MGYWDRFQKYMRGGPAAIDGWPASIPVEEFNEAIGKTLGLALSENGFELVAPRRWVRSSRAPIRDLLEVQALKGVSYTPVWGFSLDFVPHVTTGGDTKWHRTPKSARFDFMYRPIDYEPLSAETNDWCASPLATREELQEDLARVTRMVVARAMPFWQRVRGIEDLPSVYREHRSRAAVGLPFASFPQQVLASAFVLAKTGDDAGRQELAEYIRAVRCGPRDSEEARGIA